MQTAIVVEDQPVIWDYAKSCLAGLCEIKEYCASTEEAEEAFRRYRPDFVWLDCYLGELCDSGQGLKNSGILLASWMKSHKPDTKLFLFTASNEKNILGHAREVEIEGIALGGKYIRNQDLVRTGIEKVLAGEKWLSPNIVEEFELDELGKITVFEFCVVCSLLLGKRTQQIADEMDTTRKRVNNAVYRIKDKLSVDHKASREEVLDFLREKMKGSFDPNDNYRISEIVSINTMVQEFLSPVMDRIKTGELNKLKLKDVVKL